MKRDRLVARRQQVGESQSAIAHAVGVDRTTYLRWEMGTSTPALWNRRPLAAALRVTLDELDEILATHGPTADDRAAADAAWATVAPPAAGDLDALELARRVEASDLGPTTLNGLEALVDRLCRSYASTPPAELHGTLTTHRAYLGRLLDGRATLSQRRHLMALTGWVSLLLAIVDVDLDRCPAAAADLTAVRALAREAGYPLLLAWADEVDAWQAVTDGDYLRAVAACRAGRANAGAGTSAHVQLAVQEARACARLGNQRDTRRLLDEAAATLGNMPRPEHPEHHFVFDPRKLVAYTATTLAWLGDDNEEAEAYGRRAVEQYDTGATDGRWVRRLASARIDLGLVLARAGEPAEAGHLGSLALASGRLVPSNLWRATELDHLLTGRYRGTAEVADFHDRYLDTCRTLALKPGT